MSEIEMLPLRSERLVLEPLLQTHAVEMWPVLSDPALYRYLLAGPPASLEALEEHYKRLETRRSADGSQIWLNWIVREPGGPAMGFVQATVCEATNWIGYVFGKAFWGQGFAREATGCMLEHLRQAYPAELFLASADRENAASAKLLEHQGFRMATEEEAAVHEHPETDHLFVRSEPGLKPQ